MAIASERGEGMFRDYFVGQKTTIRRKSSFWYDSRTLYVGESPSGKAGAFEAPIPWFESMLPSHALLASLESMAMPNSVAQILCML